jgi:hypothetical protein
MPDDLTVRIAQVLDRYSDDRRFNWGLARDIAIAISGLAYRSSSPRRTYPRPMGYRRPYDPTNIRDRERLQNEIDTDAEEGAS